MVATRWEQMMPCHHNILVVTWTCSGRCGLTCFQPPEGFPTFGTSWGQVIRAPVSTTNGSSRRVGYSQRGVVAATK